MVQELYTVNIDSNKKSVENVGKIDNSKHVYTLTEAIELTSK